MSLRTTHMCSHGQVAFMTCFQPLDPLPFPRDMTMQNGRIKASSRTLSMQKAEEEECWELKASLDYILGSVSKDHPRGTGITFST